MLLRLPFDHTKQHLEKETTMAKVIRCKDVGFDCPGVIEAPTEEQALKQAAEHAKSAHGIREITPDILAKVKKAMHDEPARR
jgi:predicted small metal-binding protein